MLRRTLYLALSLAFAVPATAQEHLHDNYHEQMQPTPSTEEEKEPKNLVEALEECYGEYQCGHKWLHEEYKVAFSKIDCHCYTGRCRPTVSKTVQVSEEFPLGIAIFANGKWCPVTAHTLRRNDHKIPLKLRQFPAHVCVATNGCDELECAIVDTKF